MKKLILVFVLVIVIIPVTAFADFKIGAIGLYDRDYSQAGSNDVSASDFIFGLETRLKIWIFEADASALYMPDYEELLLCSDVGLSLNIWFMRFGAFVGPNFGFDTQGGQDVADAGWNLKMSGDINIGNLSIGLVGFYFADSLSNLKDTFSYPPVLGVTLLFKLF